MLAILVGHHRLKILKYWILIYVLADIKNSTWCYTYEDR